MIGVTIDAASHHPVCSRPITVTSKAVIDFWTQQVGAFRNHSITQSRRLDIEVILQKIRELLKLISLGLECF